MLEEDPVAGTVAPAEPTRLASPMLSGARRGGTTIGHPADGAAGQPPSRVDLLRVLTGLRHLRASAEPGRVFSELAGVCVPALCDDIVITIEEAGGHRYRIRQPANATPPAATTHSNTDAAQAVSAVSSSAATVEQSDTGGPARVGADVVRVTVTSVPGGGPAYTATVVCSWRTGYRPTDTDVALVGVLADHAAGVVHRERTLGQLTHPATAGRSGSPWTGRNGSPPPPGC